jgi:hypothetical protein
VRNTRQLSSAEQERSIIFRKYHQGCQASFDPIDWEYNDTSHFERRYHPLKDTSDMMTWDVGSVSASLRAVGRRVIHATRRPDPAISR